MSKAKATVKLTAREFIRRLNAIQSDKELVKILKYFKSEEGDYGYNDKFIGVRMGSIFAMAKEFENMPLTEIEKLLESDIHEARVGAVSIMDKVSRTRKITEERRKDFFDLYIRRHDRINNWDLVDLGCLHMTGSYLFGKPKAVLYKLAKSKNLWERRSAILSTCYFIRQGDVEDAYKISEILLKDKEDLVHKAAGWMLRTAGPKDPKKLIQFLEKYAPTMPRVMLRNAIEKFEVKKRQYYLALK